MARRPTYSHETPGTGEEARLLARQSAGDNAAPVSVSEISALLKRTVEDRFGHVRLRGELSGVKRAASGHLYCCLKDDSAVIDAVMWRTSAGRLGFVPEDGVEVIATGKLTTYPGRSKYQIVVESLEIAGEGALLTLLERLKAKLDAEGLFSAERKRPLPFLPEVIGVVTSPTGSVIRDILHRLGDRFPSRVVVWPVMVQGKGAAEQVAAAVRGFSALQPGGPVPRPDLVIVARGGGSVEDLWAFNEEVAVRAIAESTIPIISAVGHETDTTLSDFAADLRAPTPTAAAELAVPVHGELGLALGELRLRKRRGVARPLSLARERLNRWVERLPSPRAMAAERAQRVDELGERLRRGLAARASAAGADLARASGALRPSLLNGRRQRERERIVALRQRLGGGLAQGVRFARVELDRSAAPLDVARLSRHVTEARQRLNRVADAGVIVQRQQHLATQRIATMSSLLKQLNPYAPLARGYAVVQAGDRAITSRAAAADERALTLRFADGTLEVVPGTAPPAPPPVPPAPTRRRSSRKESDSGQQSLF